MHAKQRGSAVEAGKPIEGNGTLVAPGPCPSLREKNTHLRLTKFRSMPTTSRSPSPSTSTVRASTIVSTDKSSVQTCSKWPVPSLCHKTGCGGSAPKTSRSPSFSASKARIALGASSDRSTKAVVASTKPAGVLRYSFNADGLFKAFRVARRSVRPSPSTSAGVQPTPSRSGNVVASENVPAPLFDQNCTSASVASATSRSPSRSWSVRATSRVLNWSSPGTIPGVSTAIPAAFCRNTRNCPCVPVAPLRVNNRSMSPSPSMSPAATPVLLVVEFGIRDAVTSTNTPEPLLR